MKYVKPLSLYAYAKRLRMSLLSIDVGERRSGVCVSYPATGHIELARSLKDGSVYSFCHNLRNRVADIYRFSTSLNELAEHYRAAGFNFGFPFDKRLVGKPDLGGHVIRCIADLDSAVSRDGYFLQHMRLFSVVNEERSSMFGKRDLLRDFFLEQHNIKEITPSLYQEYMRFVTSPSNASRIKCLKKMQLDSYAAMQFTKWYFNSACGTGTGPNLLKWSPDLWDGDFHTSQAFIQTLIEDLGFDTEDIE